MEDHLTVTSVPLEGEEGTGVGLLIIMAEAIGTGPLTITSM